METYDRLVEKWTPVLNEESAGEIKDKHKKASKNKTKNNNILRTSWEETRVAQNITRNIKNRMRTKRTVQKRHERNT